MCFFISFSNLIYSQKKKCSKKKKKRKKAKRKEKEKKNTCGNEFLCGYREIFYGNQHQDFQLGLRCKRNLFFPLFYLEKSGANNLKSSEKEEGGANNKE